MSGVRVHIDVGTRLQIQISSVKARLTSELIGLKPYEFMIIAMPLIPGILDQINENDQVIVRYERDGTIYGFEAYLIRHVVRPSPMLFITYPDVVESLELRGEKRIHSLVPCEIETKKIKKESLILDLSTGGCRISIDKGKNIKEDVFKVGDVLIINFSLPNISRDFSLIGKLRNVKSDQNKLILGLQFADMDQEARNNIQTYIENLIHYVQT